MGLLKGGELLKKYLTMWQAWAAIAVVLAVLFVVKTKNVADLLPFALLLLCPIMMLFMMGDHKHK